MRRSIFFECLCLITPSVDLSQACHVRFHLLSEHVPVGQETILLIVIRCERPRTNQRHTFTDDVQQLRQFVERSFPQEAPQCRNPLIFFLVLPGIDFGRGSDDSGNPENNGLGG